MCTATKTEMTRNQKLTKGAEDLMKNLLSTLCGETNFDKYYTDTKVEDKPEETKPEEVVTEDSKVVETVEPEVIVPEQKVTITDNNVRVPEAKCPIAYENVMDKKTITPTVYINENGDLSVGEVVEDGADFEDAHIYDDVDYADEMEINKIDNSAMLEKYKELKPVEVAIRQLQGFDVLFKEDKNLVQANVFIDNALVTERSFVIDLNGCIFSDDYKWFPCLYPSKEAMGYEAYPALEMDMDVIKNFVKGEFIKDKNSIKSHSLCSDDELEVNKLFDLATLPNISAAKRKSLIKTLSKYQMDEGFKTIIYGLQKRPRFTFKQVKSEKEFTVISKTGNEYNYGMGITVKEEHPLEIVFNGNKWNVLPVAESGK